jgi:hypothetical protein
MAADRERHQRRAAGTAEDLPAYRTSVGAPICAGQASPEPPERCAPVDRTLHRTTSTRQALSQTDIDRSAHFYQRSSILTAPELQHAAAVSPQGSPSAATWHIDHEFRRPRQERRGRARRRESFTRVDRSSSWVGANTSGLDVLLPTGDSPGIPREAHGQTTACARGNTRCAPVAGHFLPITPETSAGLHDPRP